MATATKETQELSFYTLGEPFTDLIRNFIIEGSFYQAYEILKDGGAPREYIKSFFLFSSEFVGDTRDDTFGINLCSPVYKTEGELNEIYFYAISTLMTQVYRESGKTPDEVGLSIHLLRENRNFKSLLKVFSEEKIIEMILPYTNLGKWYELNPKTEVDGFLPFNGVITTDGRIIECNYQGHQELYPYLYSLGLSDSRDWTDSERTFHISSGEISGYLSHVLDHPREEKIHPTEKQISTLFKYRNRINARGMGNDSISKLLMEYTGNMINRGGKFNNLMFLHKYYPQIKLPEFSLNPIEGNACIRTSPRYSMPGLLNSKFEINENSIKEIEEDFQKYKDVIGGSYGKSYQNELHYFYQEFIEGKNGVAHFRPSDPDNYRERSFSYSVSSNRGDVVDGVNSSEFLSYHVGKRLEVIISELSKDLKESVQVEFVVTPEDEIYIVQLRILKLEPTYVSYPIDEKNILYSGKSFSSGNEELKLEDVVIVDKDSPDSSILVGKKALIVKENVEFSHVLALSKALGIPSIYGVGEVELPEEFSINTMGMKGLILKKENDGI